MVGSCRSVGWMVGLLGCWQNVNGLNAVCICVGAITGPVRVCVYALSIIYKATDRPNVNRNIIELTKVKVLARVKYSAYICNVNQKQQMSNKLKILIMNKLIKENGLFPLGLFIMLITFIFASILFVEFFAYEWTDKANLLLIFSTIFVTLFVVITAIFIKNFEL